MDREILNAIPGVRIGGEPKDPRAHFYTCSACGQQVDKRLLGDVFYHDDPDHAPLPAHA
jgi:hypothetical protein